MHVLIAQYFVPQTLALSVSSILEITIPYWHAAERVTKLVPCVLLGTSILKIWRFWIVNDFNYSTIIFRCIKDKDFITTNYDDWCYWCWTWTEFQLGRGIPTRSEGLQGNERCWRNLVQYTNISLIKLRYKTHVFITMVTFSALHFPAMLWICSSDSL